VVHAEVEQLLCILRVVGVVRELAQAIYQLDEALLDQRRVIVYGMVQRLEGLGHEVGLLVLGDEAEDVEDYLPARADELSLLVAEGGDTHDDVLFDVFLARVNVVQHDGLEGLQEHLLLAEVLALLDLQELVGQLSQRVDGIDDNVQILVGAH